MPSWASKSRASRATEIEGAGDKRAGRLSLRICGSPVVSIAMSDKSYLDWPFFEDRHRKLERELDAWAAANIDDHHGSDVATACRSLVARLGAAGWPRH